MVAEALEATFIVIRLMVIVLLVNRFSSPIRFNAPPESLNAKIKGFRVQFRGE